MTTSWAGGIAATTIFVRDLTAAKEFYRTVFECSPIFEDEASAAFRFGSSIVNLLHEPAVPELIEPAVAADRSAGARVVLTVEVADVDARVERLTAAGVQLLNGPVNRPWGPRTASFADLDGYIWEIGGNPPAN
ncbi:VOC family protein [Kitasatospora sp. NPDC002227]|uniref:VOC family protein n=1 Tax=Kitasatospora sp. NPDC002227 TaxID=3154773 RepID=UPI0033237991